MNRSDCFFLDCFFSGLFETTYRVSWRRAISIAGRPLELECPVRSSLTSLQSVPEML